MTEPVLTFAGLLRQLRAEARLTQEELAEAAGLSPRSVSDLERGINRTARKDTAGLLADALSLTGPVRAQFIATKRGRAPAADVLAAGNGAPAPGPGPTAATRALPRDIGSFTGREAELSRLLAALGGPASGGLTRPTRWPACCSRPGSRSGSRPGSRHGRAAGATSRRAGRSCCCWTTRPGTSRSGRCSRPRATAWS